MKKPALVLMVVLVPLGAAFRRGAGRAEDPSPDAPPVSRRPAWTTSRITGSPEPPPPYRAVLAFPHLKFDKPVEISSAPGTDRLFVVEQHGRIFSFPNDPSCKQADPRVGAWSGDHAPAADLLIDLRKDLKSIDPAGPAADVRDCYGLAFHPDFAKNRYCYICYVLNSKTRGEELPDGTRVSRFTVSRTDPPRIDPASEQIILTWLGGGHNGGCLKFGPDGYLYISTGDGTPPNPPDALDAGQDMTRLLSSILRIDVDRPGKDRPYTIPADNPFVNLPGARGEKWAYGFRNPWKMSFDRQTGELWVGDVGWELWEMIYRVERGGNYGWSIMEGPQPVRPEAKRGPTPIRPPALALPHSKAASITGGYVYRGRRLKELVGRYIFGDWETRRIWAAHFDDGKLVSLVELTEPTVRVIAFGEDRDGELYILDYDDGTIYQLAVNDARGQHQEFPRRLSETGLFASVADHRPAAGVVPFVINAEQWADHATAERLIALPGDSSVVVHDRPVPIPRSMFTRLLEFPKDTVLVKTLSLEIELGNPASRRIETQLLHFTGTVWNGYSFRWNDEQTDAILVGADGETRELTVIDPAAPGGRRRQTWTFAGRALCARCHNPWPEHTLAFNIPQLNRDIGANGNQLVWLRDIGVLSYPTTAAARR
ncbi:MAG TPA: PQQ-dependent sugar dehydrogenase, partial [Gemmataceae bacterium]|nr:PQQ-dependent sugar dehydrogenase [Gemmataceae bacterium]